MLVNKKNTFFGKTGLSVHKQHFLNSYCPLSINKNAESLDGATFERGYFMYLMFV